MASKVVEVIRKGELAPDFRRQIDGLKTLKKQISTANGLLAKAYLRYAQDLNRVWELAVALDKKHKNKAHREAVIGLGSLDGTQLNESTISKWLKISKYSETLAEYQDQLPPSRDALYEVAQAVAKKKNIGLLIKQNLLSSQTTYVQCRRLHSEPISKTAAKPTQRDNAVSFASNLQRVLRAHGSDAVDLNVRVNSVSRHNPNKELFSRGVAVALLTSEIDENTGVEKLKLLTVVNDEAILNAVLDRL
jgi:hypothetical protein